MEKKKKGTKNNVQEIKPTKREDGDGKASSEEDKSGGKRNSTIDDATIGQPVDETRDSPSSDAGYQGDDELSSTSAEETTPELQNTGGDEMPDLTDDDESDSEENESGG